MSRGRAAYSVGVVCEAAKDQRVATALAERVLCHEVDWIDPETVGNFCRWRGLDDDHNHLPWTAVEAQARRRRLRAHGRFQERKGVFDEHRARLAKRLFMLLDEPPAAILLVRDTDNQAGRPENLKSFRDRGSANPQIVLALPHTKLECWILAGYEPADADEEARLGTERKHLGFDPRTQAHRLTTQGTKGKRNAKKVLERLASTEREEACWLETPIETLRERGSNTGLTDYLEEVRERLVPIVAG